MWILICSYCNTFCISYWKIKTIIKYQDINILWSENENYVESMVLQKIYVNCYPINSQQFHLWRMYNIVRKYIIYWHELEKQVESKHFCPISQAYANVILDLYSIKVIYVKYHILWTFKSVLISIDLSENHGKHLYNNNCTSVKQINGNVVC